MYEKLIKRLREVEEMLTVAQFSEARRLVEEAATAIEELQQTAEHYKDGDLIDSGTYRDEFMSGVYDLCNDDPDNNRANAIIDLFDSALVIIQADIEERARP